MTSKSKKRNFFTTIGLLLFLYSAPAWASEVKFELIDFGVYEGSKGKIRQDSDGPHNETRKLSNPKLLKQTDKIKAKKGVVFGFSYKIVGVPIGEKIEILYKVKHPVFRKRFRGEPFNGYEHKIKQTIGETEVYLYELTYLWELVPGAWSFQAFYNNDILLEKTFLIEYDCSYQKLLTN